MKIVKARLLTIVVLLYSISASAYDFEVDEIFYDITSFTDFTVRASSISESVSGDLFVPSKVQFSGKELIVTEVGDDFANSNLAISSLTIDDGVISIGERAFKNCANLATVNIAQTVTKIGTECFYGCTALETFCNDGIITIGPKSFAECKNLKEVSIEKLDLLQLGTFLNCIQLTDCNFPNITSIGKEAFKNCQSLKKYNITENVNSIGGFAFQGCTSLFSIIIPNSVKELESDIFKGCTALTSISIGTGIKYLPWVFDGCTSLSDIRIEDSSSTLIFGYTGKRSVPHSYDDEPINEREYNYRYSTAMFSGVNLKSIYIGRNLSTEKYHYHNKYQGGAYLLEYYYYLPNPPFSESEISTLTIGPLVTNLTMCSSVETSWGIFVSGEPNGAFQNCRNLDSVTFCSSISSIPKNTFKGCSGIKSFEIPNSVTDIEANAFENCKRLKTLYLGTKIVRIGKGALSGCDSLLEINIKAHTPPTYETGFTSTHYINTQVNVPTGYLKEYQETEPWKNFWNLSEKSDLITSFEVDGIKYSVVSDKQVEIVDCNSEATILHLKNKIEYYGNNYDVVGIGTRAFAECSWLTELVIPSSVTTIGVSAFTGCTGLTELVIPSSVTTIGNFAFSSCFGLTSITIPCSVTSIGELAYRYCSNLTSIVVDKYNPIYDSRDNCNAIIATATDSLILGCKNTIIPHSVASIGICAFEKCKDLTNITIPNSVTRIESYAFAECSKLTKLIIPSSVTLFDVSALDCCNKLKELVFEDGDVPLKIPKVREFDKQTDILKRKVNGETVLFKIRYYKPFFVNPQIEKLYIGRNFSMDSRYTLTTGEGSYSDYYIINSYDAPFSTLPKLKELIISENVSVLGPENEYIPEVELYVTPGSFQYCSAIESVEVRNPEPPSGVEFSSAVYKKANLYVPIGSMDLYAEAEGWKDFKNIQEQGVFMLTYMVDGEEYQKIELKNGTAITPIKEPHRTGYIFSGWSEIPEMMPAHDVVVTGSFSVDDIDAIITDNLAEVYTLQGVKLRSQIPAKTLKEELPNGIYIINGKKFIVK